MGLPIPFFSSVCHDDNDSCWALPMWDHLSGLLAMRDHLSRVLLIWDDLPLVLAGQGSLSGVLPIWDSLSSADSLGLDPFCYCPPWMNALCLHSVLLALHVISSGTMGVGVGGYFLTRPQSRQYAMNSDLATVIQRKWKKISAAWQVLHCNIKFTCICLLLTKANQDCRGIY